MTGPSSARAVWEPLVYFWDGGWIGVGHSTGGVVPPHAHHAVQVTLGLEEPVRLQHEEEAWQEDAGGIVVPNATHRFAPPVTPVAMLFIDPECREGRWLRASCRTPVMMLPRERFAAHVPALLAFRERRPSAAEAAALITALVHALCEGPPPLRALDPRIARALALMRTRDARGLTLDAVAREAFLSPSRFAHLFSEQVGLPFRRYLLWRKLNRAMDAFARGSNLSNAAHAAGFSDSSHLTRTWYQMFGMAPTAMLGAATLYEIPAPFELALPAA